VKPRSAFKLKLLSAHVWAKAFADWFVWLPPVRRRLLARSERFYRALAYVASRETHNYKGERIRTFPTSGGAR
jgi:hypothetical protein